MTGPTASQRVSGTVNLTVDAYDDVGVTQVKWYVDGAAVGWDGASPWAASWDSRLTSDGSHYIFAKAADTSGTWTTSAAVPFIVDNTSPISTTLTAQVSAPAAGATVAGSVRIAATTTSDSNAGQMKWYVDGVEVGWNGAAPWEANWNSAHVADGTHRMFVKVFDERIGAWITSPAISFTVNNSGATDTGGDTPAPGWELALSDRFDGSSVDLSKWSVYGPNWTGYGGLSLRDGRAVSVQNGTLVITAQMINGTLVTGGLASKLDQKYGRFEFRVRTDVDPSLAVSGGVLTWPASGNWPIDGENNIYETGSDSRGSSFYTFIHYSSSNLQYYFKHVADPSQWHEMAMEWEPNAIRIYRDGALVWTLADTNAIPDVAHHLTIQLDAFRSYISGPVRMQVDDVRIYRRPA